MARQLATLALMTAAGAAPLAAQPAFQVKDLNPSTADGGTGVTFFGSEFVEMGGLVFFTADDGVHGTELWRTDGTAAGTVLLKDTCPGACAGMPASLAVLGSTLFFAADDGAHGRELWRSDGTTTGTIMVSDLWPGLQGSAPYWLTAVGGRLVFAAYDAQARRGLWTSDGTAAGTVRLADVDFEAPLAVAGASFFFVADDGVHGPEPWKTDGTAAGTALVKDIQPGPNGSLYPFDAPPGFGTATAAASGKLFFAADDGASGAELWVSDGTEAGTQRVKDINPGAAGSGPFALAAFGGGVVFAADDGVHGQEPWISDGTDAGTTLLADVQPGGTGSLPREMTAAAGRVFFSADDGVHGRELWSSDGTAAGTALVADLRPAGDAFSPFGPAGFTALSGALLFFADDGVHGAELWTSDGTAAGTHLLVDLNPGPSSSWFPGGIGPAHDHRLVTSGGLWYFRPFTDAGGIDVYVSDGTAAGTRKLAPINVQTSAFQLSFNGALLIPDRSLLDLGGTLLFTASDGTSGLELARSDGTAAGTSIVKDIQPGAVGSEPNDFALLGGRALFSADDGTGETLWSSDGTAAGTLRLADVPPAGSPALGPVPQASYPAVLGNRLFFTTGGSSPLWSTDGTGAGTHAIPTTAQGPSQLTPFAGRLFFTAQDVEGNELWTSDGTAAGTARFADVQPGAASSSPGLLAVAGSRLFFTADDGVHGRELWATDGTPAGTGMVKDVKPGAGSGVAFEATGSFAVAGDTLFFLADDGVAGEELWRSDGTAAGTALVKDVFPGPRSSEIQLLTAAGDRAFFVADDGVHGRELWTSDGTAAGTRLVADLLPGADSSRPTELAAVDGKLLFSAYDGVHGREPWITDGTAAGTALLADVAPGPLSSSPYSFTASGANVYFAANDNATGFELWAVARSTVAGALGFYTVAPCRVLDTRSGTALAHGVARRVTVAGACGIPADAKAVAANWTVVPHGQAGHLTAYPAFGDRPATSTLNFGDVRTRANDAILPLGQGAVEAFAILASGAGQVDVLLDVSGYFE